MFEVACCHIILLKKALISAALSKILHSQLANLSKVTFKNFGYKWHAIRASVGDVGGEGGVAGMLAWMAC